MVMKNVQLNEDCLVYKTRKDFKLMGHSRHKMFQVFRCIRTQKSLNELRFLYKSIIITVNGSSEKKTTAVNTKTSALVTSSRRFS